MASATSAAPTSSADSEFSAAPSAFDSPVSPTVPSAPFYAAPSDAPAAPSAPAALSVLASLVATIQSPGPFFGPSGRINVTGCALSRGSRMVVKANELLSY